jgi:transposase-like protein
MFPPTSRAEDRQAASSNARRSTRRSLDDGTTVGRAGIAPGGRTAEPGAAAFGAAGRDATGRCPHCSADRVVRWGRTGRGLQRRRCCLCRKTFTAATGTVLPRVRQRDKLRAVARAMLAPQPLSCRALGAELALDRMTLWRWRRRIALAWHDVNPAQLTGRLENAQVSFRESRKASREWVDHARQPATAPRPDRLRWIDYRLLDVPLPDPMSDHLVQVTLTRGGDGRCAIAIAGARRPRHEPAGHVDRLSAIGTWPTAADASPVGRTTTNGSDAGDPSPAWDPAPTTTPATRRSRSLEDGFRCFMAAFSGPATRHLAVYTSWFAARSVAREPSTRRLLQQLVASQHHQRAADTRRLAVISERVVPVPGRGTVAGMRPPRPACGRSLL